MSETTCICQNEYYTLDINFVFQKFYVHFLKTNVYINFIFINPPLYFI